MDKYGITSFSMEDVERFGIHEVTRQALEAINPEGKRSLHVSFDIDSLDPVEAPSTGTAGESSNHYNYFLWRSREVCTRDSLTDITALHVGDCYEFFPL